MVRFLVESQFFASFACCIKFLVVCGVKLQHAAFIITYFIDSTPISIRFAVGFGTV